MNYYQLLITGEQKVYPVPHLQWIDKIKILRLTLGTIKSYKTKGARSILGILHDIPPIKRIYFENTTQSFLFARDICVFVQMIINFNNPKAICLERSSVICTALRSMGLPAQVVIGRKASANSASDYNFHAWVELDSIPVNDHYANKTCFIEIERFPHK
ncbi:lasso peptide biosynthesis B2 protein [Paenibacillus donghaensis]|uniref:lasso peptide biosynthesis B2 protein n=1 Tax=Paenibacillus donghaensis TaxID=414771 RepID=UPI001883FBA8|nr:lasso peptide biosynthesis B2 protein [Paenibacillus donghaensis]MBE9914424.1 lasso peptide biosynthesis B2 protein [Paenibacillus donghaensis]